tara:strand:+ start:68 stop:871 length:804 start_codon:yes stop_codon:yes gene_type:complete
MMVRICSVKGCKNKHNAKGYCGKHYNKFKKYGDPLHTANLEQSKKKMSNSQKKWLEKYGNPMTGRKHSDETKNKISESNKGRIPPNKGTKGIMKSNSGSFKKGYGKGIKKSKKYLERVWTDERREMQKKILRQSRKNTARPNNPEKAIGAILTELGIKFKFLKDVSYKTFENKTASKEMDLVWKDSDGKKKIIEYNGRYHFDPRENKPDDIVTIHGKSRNCENIWDEEIMILNQIRKEGYEILVIWQMDFLKDIENTTKKILRFANI